MQWTKLLITLMLFWSEAISEECTTPLGQKSSCVFINECKEFQPAIKAESTPNVITFLQQSLCRYEDGIPKVCCGPLPSHYDPLVPLNTNSLEVDPVVGEDSYLATRDNCGVDTNSDRILGGSATDLDELPWMALLGYLAKTSSTSLVYKCGGALINNRYVLTAAHCITGAVITLGELRTVRLGEYDTEKEKDCLADICADPVQEILVHSTYHPDYLDREDNKENDIGLVRLAKRAKFTHFVQPICLVVNNLPLKVGSEFYVAGWGRFNYQFTTMSAVKLKVQVPLFDKAECDEKYRPLGIILNDKQICAGGITGQDSCMGDSGGPLMRKSSLGKWESVGIISFGNGCGKKGWPGVYTSVPRYIDWIKQTMRLTNI